MPDPCRILVVDDEPHCVEFAVRALRRLGRVAGAASAAEAWSKLEARRFDLVVADQRMPGTSGVELLGRVAERDEHVGRILLTGYADLESTVEAINRGRVHAYLHKPCDLEQLRATVRGVLARVGLARENERLLAVVGDRNAQLEASLTSLREAQERTVASERLAAIGRMIAMIVHDLRGPLSVVLSSGSGIVREAREAGHEELACLGEAVLGEGERMQRMCAELLDVTRASQGGGERREEDLDELVATALAHFAEEAGRAGVRLELDLRSGARVAVDEDRLRRALLNLAYNALEAMPDGGELRVESRRDGGVVRVRVVDGGVGIPDEIRDRIFEPFVTAGKVGGSGLGLAVVRKVVEDHGGRIAVAKAEGGGTVFEIELPLADPGA